LKTIRPTGSTRHWR